MTRLLVQYFDYIKPVDISEVQVSHPKEGIRPGLRLAMASHLEMDCSNDILTAQ